MTEPTNKDTVKPASFQAPGQRAAAPVKRIPRWQLVLGASALVLLYGLWIEPLLLYCTVAPIPYWALAFRLRRNSSDPS